MIPVVYERNNWSINSDGAAINGRGRIPECVECIVSQNTNNQFECRFTIPTNAKHYADIVEGNMIACKVPELSNIQLFDIYGRDETINGLTTFYANHISYRLNYIILNPVELTDYAYPSELCEALNNVNLYAGGALRDFRFSSDITTVFFAEIINKVPTPMRKIIIDYFDELYEGDDSEAAGSRMGIIWDNYNVILKQAVGNDKYINVYYGKNIIDYSHNIDYSKVCNGCVPYAINNDGEVYTLKQASQGRITYVMLPGIIPANELLQPADVSKMRENPDTWPPTASELSALGLKWLQDNAVNIPIQNTEISFEQLWQTQDYATIAALEQVKLYDRINVVYGPGKVKLENVPIVATEYDVLNERYSSMQLGTIQQNYGDTVRGIIEKTLPNGIDGKAIQIQIKDASGNWETVEAKLNRGIICLND